MKKIVLIGLLFILVMLMGCDLDINYYTLEPESESEVSIRTH